MPRSKLVVDENREENMKEKERKHFDPSDGILCRSVVQGGLYMEGAKTNMLYSWSDYGDVTEVEYRDLVAAVRQRTKYVMNPWFIIEDEDFLNEFPMMKEFYEQNYTVKDLIKILSMPEHQMIEEIKKLPKGVLDSIKSLAAKQVANGTLDSVKKIRALDQFFGTDLNLLSSLINNANE